MPPLADRVSRTIRRHALIAPGTRVLVALSGGADSVALLTLLCAIARDDKFVVAGVAHLNHQLRGQDADADEAFCRTLAATLSLPIEVEAVDVARLAREMSTSIEDAAHTARHAVFERAAQRLSADCVAVGHTRDDQAETFLLRLLRGAGPRGLAGIHLRTGRVIRPLLDCSRDELRTFLREERIEFREDSTNADVAIPRNRVRHELIPFLQARFSPGVIGVLDREAAIAREDAEFFDGAAAEALRRLATKVPGGLAFPAEALLTEPRAIARRVVRQAQQTVSRGAFIGFDTVDAFLAFAASGERGPLDLPGHRIERRGDRILLSTSGNDHRRASGPWPAFRFNYSLQVPGRVAVPEAGCAVSAETGTLSAGASTEGVWPLASPREWAVIEASRLQEPLTVRNRLPGDIFRPLGLRGHKKLQDFFVDRKVRRADRDTVPLVVDGRGQIVWVAGHVVSEEFRVTARTEAVVILRLLKLGGRG